jgi:hypothetical protein
MEDLDQLVLDDIVGKIFTPDRVQTMLKKYGDRLNLSSSRHDDELKRLQKEGQKAIDRIYTAVEQGILPTDASVKERTQKHHARRQEILARMAVLRHWLACCKKQKRENSKECPLLVVIGSPDG